MSFYYVSNNRQYDGSYEVHKEGCGFMPLNKTFLGHFSSCEEAVKEAKRLHLKSKPCIYCTFEYQQAQYRHGVRVRHKA